MAVESIPCPDCGVLSSSVSHYKTRFLKHYALNKMLQHQVSYNSLHTQLQEDFGSKTAVSTLHTWTQKTKLTDIDTRVAARQVLHTDEKHPSKKK